MANRQRSNFQRGALSSQVLTGATSATSDGFASLPVISGAQRLALTFDPAAEHGAPEVVWVTVHNSGSTTVTIIRGQEGTTARTHPVGTKWVHAPTAEDFGPHLADNVTLEPNADGNIQIKASGVGTTHLANGSVTQAKIADGAVVEAKLANAAVTKPKIEASQQLPPGVIFPFAGSGTSVPTGWLLCAGQEVSRTTYADLFAVVGTTYGAGNGTTTFNLPDLRGRIPVGLDNMGGVDAGRLSVPNTLGGSGGAETHALTIPEMPSHDHVMDHNHASATTSSAGSHSHTPSSGTNFVIFEGSGNAGLTVASGGTKVTTTNTTGAHTHTVDLPNYAGNTGSTGSGQAHNNMPPYMLMNYIIKT